MRRARGVGGPAGEGEVDAGVGERQRRRDAVEAVGVPGDGDVDVVEGAGLDHEGLAAAALLGRAAVIAHAARQPGRLEVVLERRGGQECGRAQEVVAAAVAVAAGLERARLGDVRLLAQAGQRVVFAEDGDDGPAPAGLAHDRGRQPGDGGGHVEALGAQRFLVRFGRAVLVVEQLRGLPHPVGQLLEGRRPGIDAMPHLFAVAHVRPCSLRRGKARAEPAAAPGSSVVGVSVPSGQRRGTFTKSTVVSVQSEAPSAEGASRRRLSLRKDVRRDAARTEALEPGSTPDRARSASGTMVGVRHDRRRRDRRVLASARCRLARRVKRAGRPVARRARALAGKTMGGCTRLRPGRLAGRPRRLGARCRPRRSARRPPGPYTRACAGALRRGLSYRESGRATPSPPSYGSLPAGARAPVGASSSTWPRRARRPRMGSRPSPSGNAWVAMRAGGVIGRSPI